MLPVECTALHCLLFGIAHCISTCPRECREFKTTFIRLNNLHLVETVLIQAVIRNYYSLILYPYYINSDIPLNI